MGTDDIDRSSRTARAWLDDAVRRVEADANRTGDTRLIPFPLPARPGVDLYLKDESTHPTGSLAHRWARSLFLHALCSGRIAEGTTVVDAPSGSTAISEAYFAAMLGLPYVAVLPASTGDETIALVERAGGRCHLVPDPDAGRREAARIAREADGHHLDGSANAERATDWRGNDTIAESIYSQLALERFPIPSWIVVGTDTGATSATIGRYLRYRRHATRLAVVDPEHSAFFAAWRDGDDVVEGRPSRIEDIGGRHVGPGFVPGVVDRMIAVPDAASIATARAVEPVLGRRVGPSTGTNLWGALRIARESTWQARPAAS